ncbi:MAG: hypothetical protein E6L04_07400 [Thaumarchaeota archaeon]|nr:MAG: hypothetical protein E6L04_07400 [Nitrososphaerota archaeon]
MRESISLISSKAAFNQLYEHYLAVVIAFRLAIVNYFKSAFGIPMPSFTNMSPEPSIASTAVDVIVAFILALIASLIGVNLIGPVATAVGGALKNGNLTGAANSLTAQITLIFVTVIILGVVVFLAMFGHLAGTQADKV